MEQNTSLLIHNIEALFSASVLAAMALLVFINNPKKTVNVTLALTCITTIIFLISHVIGVSTADPELSRSILMWNISIIFTCMFNFHCVMAVLGQAEKKKYLVRFVYITSIALAAFYVIFPDAFLLTSVPKMYFPNYYVAGHLHWAMRLIFNIIIPVYFIYELSNAYRNAESGNEKNRIMFFAIALTLAWAIGIIPILLIYNIPIDPAYGISFALFFAIPFTYAVLKYNLLNIKVVAQKAFIYGVSIAALFSILLLVNSLNTVVQFYNPQIPFWLIPLCISILSFGIGFLVWKKLREGDILKYEFITTATHKFRTPLTHIKWASENLSKMNLSEDVAAQIDYIQNANAKLVELTNVLMNVSGTEKGTYDYRPEKLDLSSLAGEIVKNSLKQAEIKQVKLITEFTPQLDVICDASRIRFVIQTLVENAIHYTRENGTVKVITTRNGQAACLSVHDDGIGINNEESKLIFSKFYRGKEAREADTEGMGIGLFICRDIISKHNGKIWAESAGRNKGSTFSFWIPSSN